MSWNRQLNLVIDVDAIAADNAVRPHAGAGVPSPIAGGLRAVLVAGDLVRCRLFFWSSNLSQNIRLVAGLQVVICGKNNVTPSGKLFEATGHTEVNIGTVEVPVWAYDLLVDLSTTELASALATLPSLTSRTDIELADAGGGTPTTWRFLPTILKQVYEGGTLPTPAEPPYPASAAVLTTNHLVTAEIPEDATEITLDISGFELDAPPAAVLPIIRRPSAEAPRIVAVDFYGATASQVTVGFSAAVPTAGYYISALIVK